jgi:hypothetical protein
MPVRHICESWDKRLGIMRYLSFSVIVCLLMLAPSSSRGAIIFEKVADTGTAIPGGSGNFTSLIGSVASGRNVAFVGSGNAAQQGVYVWRAGALSRVADRTTPLPSGAGKMTNMNRLSIEGSNIAFYNSGDVSSGFLIGIYKNVGAGLVKVSETLNGGFSRPVISGSSVYVFFDGAGVGNESIITDSGGSVHALVSDGLPVPNGTGMLEVINCNVAAANGGVAFYGSSGVQRGIYLYRNGQVSRVADRNIAAPGTAGNFGGFSNISLGYDGTDVAFAADDHSGVPGLYRTRAGALVNIATANTVVAGYGKIGFGDKDGIRMSIDGNCTVFSNGQAIFIASDNSIQEVIGVGNQLLGKTISSLSFGSAGFRGGDEIAFDAVFTDGSSGVFLATVPLPAGVHVGWAMGAWVAYRARAKRRGRR